MKIVNSSIQMEAASVSARWQTSNEQAKIWGDPPLTKEKQNPWVFVDLSEQGKQLAEGIQQTNSTDDALNVLSDKDKDKLQLLTDFIYVLTGKRIKFVIPKGFDKSCPAAQNRLLNSSLRQSKGRVGASPTTFLKRSRNRRRCPFRQKEL